MVETIETEVYPFVMCNFAPPDMVGHTGKYEPAIVACEATGNFFPFYVKLKLSLGATTKPTRLIFFANFF